MPKAGAVFGPEKYKTLRHAYSAYERARLLETTNPALAPRERFANIWGWNRKKIAKPGQ